MVTSILYEGLTGELPSTYVPNMPDVTQVKNPKQPVTNNYLSSNYFKLVFPRLPTVTYFCQSVNLPSFYLHNAVQSTSLGLTIKHPGDKYQFDDLRISFIVDENMKNWMEIYEWMEGIANLESNRPIKDGGKVLYHNDWYSDARIIITNSAYNPILEVIIKDVIPIHLGGIDFSSTVTDNIPVNVFASFSYTSYRIEKYPYSKRTSNL